jgi:flagellar assembly protein FliH
MGQIEKFLFNVSFDEAELAAAEAAAKAAVEDAEAEEAEVAAAPTYSEEELEAARREGFEAGKAEGIQEAGDAVETQISSALTQLAGQIGAMFQQQTAANAALFDDAINIAIAISHKCFPHLSETNAPRVIEDMVRDVLAEILEEPRALIHVHPDLVPPLNTRISAITEAANFEGQVIIIDDESMPLGDCRVSWSSGSAERNMNALWQRVDEIVETNIRAVTQPAGGESAAAGTAPTPSAPPHAPAAAPDPAAAAPQPAASDAGTADAGAGAGGEPDGTEAQDDLSIEINNLEGFDDDASMPEADTAATDMPAADADSEEIDADDTGAHLEAGPGIMAEPDEATILEPDAPDAEQAEEPDTTDDAADESRPPPGANS